MSSLADSEKKLLLKVARRALRLAAERDEPLTGPPPEEQFQDKLNDRLTQPGGAFVTLRLGKRLRGCIGQLPSSVPLIHVVAHCSKAAALEDPRFEPVRPEELEEIDIELSVLTVPEDISPERIEPGRHGLIVTNGSQRGLLLPQVAEEFRWTAQRFLEETCIKGGFDRNAWKDQATRIEAFTAEVFSEEDLRRENGT
jgi:AmmeMemoRadiSam system protein A